MLWRYIILLIEKKFLLLRSPKTLENYPYIPFWQTSNFIIFWSE